MHTNYEHLLGYLGPQATRMKTTLELMLEFIYKVPIYLLIGLTHSCRNSTAECFILAIFVVRDIDWLFVFVPDKDAVRNCVT